MDRPVVGYSRKEDHLLIILINDRLLIVDNRRLACDGLLAMFTTLENFQAEAGGTEETGRMLDRFSADVAWSAFASLLAVLVTLFGQSANDAYRRA